MKRFITKSILVTNSFIPKVIELPYMAYGIKHFYLAYMYMLQFIDSLSN